VGEGEDQAIRSFSATKLLSADKKALERNSQGKRLLGKGGRRQIPLRRYLRGGRKDLRKKRRKGIPISKDASGKEKQESTSKKVLGWLKIRRKKTKKRRGKGTGRKGFPWLALVATDWNGPRRGADGRVPESLKKKASPSFDHHLREKEAKIRELTGGNPKNPEGPY